MVPVGEGSGEPNALMCSSCCCIVGMLILRGDMWGRSGRGGREGCSLSLCSSSSRSDINWILITVLGKRNTHLKAERMVEDKRQEHPSDQCPSLIKHYWQHIVIVTVELLIVSNDQTWQIMFARYYQNGRKSHFNILSALHIICLLLDVTLELLIRPKMLNFLKLLLSRRWMTKTTYQRA